MAKRHHYIKIAPMYYEDISNGYKNFEIRFNDRDYHIGDVLHLREYCYGRYTGRVLVRVISYFFDDPNYCKEGYVVLGIKEI